MPEIGELTRPITIRAATLTRTASGGELEDWTTAAAVATCRAKIEPMRGAEQVAAGIDNATMEYRVWILYRPGISTKHRIYHRSQVLEILSVQNFHEANEWLEIMAREWRA